MFIVMNRVMVKDEWRDQLIERFTHRKGKIDLQPGFVRMQVLEPEKPGLPTVVLTEWEDKSAFEQWVGSEDFREAHQNPMPKEAFNEGGGVETFHVRVAAEK